MAEVIGLVASGISIAQLAGQMVKSIVKLKGFWDQVKDAPDEISYLIKELETISSILYELEPRHIPSHHEEVFGSHIFRQSLALCREGTRELSDLVDVLSLELSSSNRFRRARGSVKTVIKKEQIKRYKSRLKGVITLLSLSHQCYSRAIAQIQFDVLYAALPRESRSSLTQFQTEQPLRSEIPRQTSASSLITSDRVVATGESPTVHFESPFFGSLSVCQQPILGPVLETGQPSRHSNYQIITRYHEPVWLSYRAWQFCCYRSRIGWTFQLTTYNIVPDCSPQFRCAQLGQLSKLQIMIAGGKASIFDQRRDGTSLLSIAAIFGQVDTCKWLLEQGAHTDHVRFGSILNQVLYYGGWMSFQKGLPMFEIARLLQQKEDFDIFNCSDSRKGRCAFYGPKEIFSWFINYSCSRGYRHTDEDHIQLALNIARNIDHNGPELVKFVLAKMQNPQIALQAKDQDKTTLLHRIASRLGGSIAYEGQGLRERIKVWDEGGNSLDTLLDNGWRSLLRGFKLDGVDVHAVSSLEATPLTMGFRTLIRVWTGSNLDQLQALSQYLEIWLSDLENLGICLLSYGKEERRLQSEGLVLRDFCRHTKINGSNSVRDESYGTLRLIGFESSSSVEKWKVWWSEPTDEFAGEFWRMCERKPARIPGAWLDDFD